MLLVTHLPILTVAMNLIEIGETLGCYKKNLLLENYAKRSDKNYPASQFSYAKNQNESTVDARYLGHLLSRTFWPVPWTFQAILG